MPPRVRVDALFNHLVGTNQEGLRNPEAQRLGGLEVQRHAEIRRLFDRQVAGLGATQNLVHILCAAANLVDVVRAVGGESARFD